MSTTDLDHLYEEVDRLLLAENVSPREDRDGVRRIVTQAVGDYGVRADRGVVERLADPAVTVEEIVSDVCDYGVLGTVFALPDVEDLTIKREQIRFFRQGRWQAPVRPTTERRNRHVILRLIADAGVPLDQANPTLDGVQVLEGRGRLAGAIPPVSPVLDMVIRLYVLRSVTVEDLVDWDMLPQAAADLLALDLRAKGAAIISGEAGSGKTTVMSALLGQADPGHVVRLVEEYREIDFTHDLGGSHQMVPGPSDNQPCRSIAGLVRLALRLRPDIVSVGEVRDRVAWDLASAAGVGAGFLCTVHAPTAARALERLVLLSRSHEDRPEPELIRDTFSDLIHFVAHTTRGTGADGSYIHQVAEVRAVFPPMDASRGFTSEVIFERPDGLGTPMRWTKLEPPTPVVDRLERLLPTGVHLRDLLSGVT